MQIIQSAVRRVVRQALADSRVEGQVRGQRTQYREVDLVAIDGQLARAMLVSRRPVGAKIEGQRCHTTASGQAKMPGSDGIAVAVAPHHQPPVQPLQYQPRQIGAEADIDARQAYVGSNAGPLLLGEIQPQSQAASTGRQVDRVVDPLLPRRQIGVVEFGVGLPLPCLQQVEIAALEIAAHIQAAGQCRWRFGDQRKAVTSAAVAQIEGHAGQLQRRRSSQFVGPGQPGIANDNPVLCQQPIGEGVVIAPLADLQAGDEELAGTIATNGQARAVDFEASEARLEVPQRRPRQIHRHVLEFQRHPPLGIADGQTMNLQMWPPTTPVGGQLANGHRSRQRLSQGLLDIAAIAADIGQDAVTKQQNQASQQEIGEHHNPERQRQRQAIPRMNGQRVQTTANDGEAHGPGRAKMGDG